MIGRRRKKTSKRRQFAMRPRSEDFGDKRWSRITTTIATLISQLAVAAETIFIALMRRKDNQGGAMVSPFVFERSYAYEVPVTSSPASV
jgi:hypothetical protein